MQHDGIPTPEEFEAARKRELARLDLRLSSLTGEEYLTPEDRTTLEGDTPQSETRDRETVRNWTATKDKRLVVARRPS